MSIIVSTSGERATKLTKTAVRSEEYLQQYIYRNPETLPLDEYKEDLQLLILAREFPTGSGPIDALGMDQDGEIYLIETKLYKNPDKRLVLAQVLDYGASLWRTFGDPEEFITRLQEAVSKNFNVSLAEKIKDAFTLPDDGVPLLLDALRENVSAGTFRFVVLMDRLEDRLKDLISFMNQNSRFDVFGVELEFYKYGELEILIPTLFGAEVKKSVGSSSSAGGRGTWDRESFFEDAGRRLNDDRVKKIEALYDWASERADEVTFGTGRYKGSFNPKFHHVNSKKSVFTVGSDGVLTLNFQWLSESEESRGYAERIEEELKTMSTFSLPDDVIERFHNISVDDWTSGVHEFTTALERALFRDDMNRMGEGAMSGGFD